MKYILPLLILYSGLANAQSPELDSLYDKFRYCIINYVCQQKEFADSNMPISCYNKYLPFFKDVYGPLGSHKVLDFYEMKDSMRIYTINGKMSAFDNELPYDIYVGSILTSSGNKCPFASLKEGYWLYLNCPWETWAQFHFDGIMGSDTSYLAPTLDVITVKNNHVFYERKMIVCAYTKANGFFVKTVYPIRDKTVICKDYVPDWR